ncbi:hypothetical protein PV326_007728 [Microctonus aethiopoides]|uniref:Uncharacterized protein n=1 Tax=Microctonus aethiopoides TaxID=144406 RepID=A0AA39EXV7_9HYME|nr:hypothetical protein PV326_007728 [Microctonus aethiopoides]KAK0157231.1 hypothetical protein PV328_011710 [Microctonus aethiopoides]
MDIRKFFAFCFARSLKRKKTDGSSSVSDEQDKVTTIWHVSSSVTSVTTTTTGYIQPQELPRPGSSRYLAPNPDSLMDDCNENDIGRYVGRAHMLSTEKKKELIENCAKKEHFVNIVRCSHQIQIRLEAYWDHLL